MERLKTFLSSLFHKEKSQPVYEEPHSARFKQQRRFWMVMPLLVLPFMTLMFWALGGGQANTPETPQLAHKGFNMQLPGPNLDGAGPLDKLGYYEKADADSSRLKAQIKNDPYYTQQTASAFPLKPDSLIPGGSHSNRLSSYGNQLSMSPYGSLTYQDPEEGRVYQKLNQLNQALSQASQDPGTKPPDARAYSSSGTAAVNGADLDRLEQMMLAMQQHNGGDPEMQQLDGMLEKILDIQHPQRVREKISQTSQTQKGKVFAVKAKAGPDPVTLLANARSAKRKAGRPPDPAYHRNGFYSLPEEKEVADAFPNAIAAVVHETQTVFSGSVVKFRLTGDVSVNGMLVPKGSFLFGTATLNGERLNIKINSIRFQNSLLPVELSVYDLDGLAGIYIPGAITHDVARQSADRAIQDIGFSTLDPSLQVQAASAGVEVAKSLFSKKAKLVKVTVKAGYQVLLRDEKQL